MLEDLAINSPSWFVFDLFLGVSFYAAVSVWLILRAKRWPRWAQWLKYDREWGWDYYVHQSLGRVKDYFGEIGTPIKVSWFRYEFQKCFDWRTTRVPKGSSIEEVMKRAHEDAEAR